MVNAEAWDRCSNLHPRVVAAQLERAYEDQMQPGEGSA
jgi:hypothetical protein